jgi:hypothetical protein
MKVLRILIMMALVVGISSTLHAQACGPSMTMIYIHDGDGNITKDAKFEFTDLAKDDASLEKKWNWFKEDAYVIYFYAGKPYGKHLLKISAQGFEPTEQAIVIDEAQYQAFNLKLQPSRSKIPAVFERLSHLSGKVSGENGKEMAGVKVVLKAADGKRFEAVTDKDGYYRVDIPLGSYFIEFAGTGDSNSLKHENFRVDKYHSNLSAVLAVKTKSGNSKTEIVCTPSDYSANESDCVLVIKNPEKEKQK